jgi:hypothetical protein
MSDRNRRVLLHECKFAERICRHDTLWRWEYTGLSFDEFMLQYYCRDLEYAANVEDLKRKLHSKELFIVKRSDLDIVVANVVNWQMTNAPRMDISNYPEVNDNRLSARSIIDARWYGFEESRSKLVPNWWQNIKSPTTRSSYYQEMKLRLDDRTRTCLGLTLDEFMAEFFNREYKTLGPDQFLQKYPFVADIKRVTMYFASLPKIQLGIDYATMSRRKYQITKQVWNIGYFPGASALDKVKAKMNAELKTKFGIAPVQKLNGVKCNVERLLDYILEDSKKNLGLEGDKLTVKITADGFGPSQNRSMLMWNLIPITPIAQQSPWHTFPLFLGECNESDSNLKFIKELLSRQFMSIWSKLCSLFFFVACMDLKCAWLLFGLFWPTKFEPKKKPANPNASTAVETTPTAATDKQPKKKKRPRPNDPTNGEAGKKVLLFFIVLEFCPHCHCPANEAHWFDKWKDSALFIIRPFFPLFPQLVIPFIYCALHARLRISEKVLKKALFACHEQGNFTIFVFNCYRKS